MTGVEMAVRYLFGWAARNARRVEGQADHDAEAALDAGMRRLHDVVSRTLGDHSALRLLTEEAETGRPQPTEFAAQRLRIALEDAAWSDPAFGGALRAALASIPAAPAADARTVGG